MIHPAGMWRLLCLLPWLAMPSARAALSGWIEFTPQIKGEATESNHVNWIEIQSFQIDAELAAGQPGAFYITKSLDSASPKLFVACSGGTSYSHANLDLNLISGTDKPVDFLRLEMEDVRVTSAQTTGNDVERPLEAIGLAFGRITYTYYFTSPSGATSSFISNFDYRSKTGSTGVGTNSDTDADGMPDAWETTYNLAIGSNDGNADADGDGLSNLNEYLLGTNPRSGTSFFKAQLTPVTGSPGVYQLTWNAVAGTTYVVEWSPDLKTPFTTQRTVTATGTTHSENFVNPGSVGFYRVRPQL